MAIATINPASGETLRTFEPLSDTQIDAKLLQPPPLDAAFQLWSSYYGTTNESVGML